MRLTDSMIRVTNASIGANGRAVRERPFVVYIHGHLTLKDKRGNQRRFASRSAAYTAAREYITKHNQATLCTSTTTSSDINGRLYERVAFDWGTHIVERLTGSIALPRPFTLDWPGHVNHDRAVFPVLVEGALGDQRGGLLFVRPEQIQSTEEPACVVSMGCLCVCHAAGMDAREPCDTSEERARRIASGTDLEP